MPCFDFLEKDLGLISPTHFANNFSRKMYMRFYQLTKFHCPNAFTS